MAKDMSPYGLQTQIDKLIKQFRKQILYSSGPLSGDATCCHIFGIDYSSGDLYYKDANGDWAITAGGGGGTFDSTVEFSVNSNPNTGGTTFSPNTPELTTVIYVDNTGTASNGAQWTWNGAAYVLYVAPYWSIHGNSGITTDNYIGTTNTAPLRFKVNNIQSGIIDNTLNNIALGPLSLPITTTGDQNTAFGEFALGSNTNGRNNTALGAYALGSNTSGEYNLALGAGSLQSNTTGTRNTAVGQGALYSTNGTYNVAMGWSALNFNTGTGYNTAVGSFSLRTAGTGTLNSALGYESGQLNTDGANNIFIGNKSGAYNTTVSNQVFINSINRTNYTGDTTQSPIYIQQHATVASQLINFNAGVTTLRGDTTAAKLRFLEPSGSGTNYSEFQAVAQSANITYSLPPTVGAAGTVLTDVAGNGVLTWAAASGGSIPISSLTAATGTNDIDNTDYGQVWNWNSLSSGIGLRIFSNSTVADNSDNTLMQVATSGINSNASQTTYALEVGNTHSGTGSTNYGINLAVSGASTSNIGIRSAATGTGAIAALFDRGSVDLGTVGTESGVLNINGSTSGTITIQPQAAAGTYTLTLPTTDGGVGEFLQTDGSGVLSWAAAGGSGGWGTTGTVATLTGIADLATGGNAFTISDVVNGSMLTIDPTGFLSEIQSYDGTSYTKLSLPITVGVPSFQLIADNGTDPVAAITGSPAAGGSGAITYEADNHLFAGGPVNLGTVGVENGTLKFNGGTSGTVTLQSAAAAGTWTLTLPTTNGNAGEILSTDGSGITTWEDVTTYFSNRFGGDGSVGNPITPIKVTTTASSATPTPDADASTMFTVTALAANAVFAAPTGTPVDGQDLLIRIKDNATPRTLGWNAIYRAGTDFALPTTTVASETIYVQFIYNAADATWDAIGLTQGF